LWPDAILSLTKPTNPDQKMNGRFNRPFIFHFSGAVIPAD